MDDMGHDRGGAEEQLLIRSYIKGISQARAMVCQAVLLAIPRNLEQEMTHI